MGELPHFIDGVPEESIEKQKVSSNPTRQRISITSAITGQTSQEIYNVPKRYFLEVISINFSCVAIAPATIGRFVLVADLSGPQEENVAVVNLDHNEHNTLQFSFPKESYFIGEGLPLTILSQNVGAGSKFEIIIKGNLIDRAEVVQKLNIL